MIIASLGMRISDIFYGEVKYLLAQEHIDSSVRAIIRVVRSSVLHLLSQYTVEALAVNTLAPGVYTICSCQCIDLNIPHCGTNISHCGMSISDIFSREVECS